MTNGTDKVHFSFRNRNNSPFSRWHMYGSLQTVPQQKGEIRKSFQFPKEKITIQYIRQTAQLLSCQLTQYTKSDTNILNI
jgi:hypothetical protein